MFFYEMAELIMTYYHLKTDDSLRQWIDKSLGKYERSVMERNPSFWNGFDFSCDKFTQLFEDEIITELNKMPTKDYLLYTEFLPKNRENPFDESNKNFFCQLHNPSLKGLFINPMAFDVSLQRDNNLCQMVNDQLAAGHQRILIVYGKGHFGVNERSLQTILNHY